MKKYLIICICLVMVGGFSVVLWGMGATAQGQTVSQNCTYLEPIYGDANEDLEINMADVITVERQILGLSTLTQGADANLDGNVSVGDVVMVERQILGLSPIYGDVDGNLKIDENDIVKLERIILGIDIVTIGADANCDDRVSMGDVTWISKMIAKVN